MEMTDRKMNIFTAVLVTVILAAGVVTALSTRFKITFNTTESLDYRIFITDKSVKKFHAGDYVKFMLPSNKYFNRSHWTKRIAGVPGDRITVSGRDVFINGVFVGHAKEKSASNTKYYPITPGIIPHNFYFLQADHEDSYDSRYRSFGLVHESTFIGRDYPLWKRGSSS